MRTSLFDYTFPKELVAQHPLPRRDDSRLMVLNRVTQSWGHHQFPDLLNYLRPNDLLIFNNAEADLIEVEGTQVPPLPPYIKRKKLGDFTEQDYQRYRTVYASVPGSKAAPTAGFHFSEEMLARIKDLGAETQFVTLHVSYDTYKPIRTEQIEQHPMHGEQYVVPQATAEAIIKAKQQGRRVVAVGTTTVRVLESWAAKIPPPTNLFIQPGFKFQIVDALLTNFHRPHSTVLVMVSAFAGREFILSAYEEAIKEKYRFFSYGDCMLIL